jgi:cell division protein FtsW (lipid II flippase)
MLASAALPTPPLPRVRIARWTASLVELALVAAAIVWLWPLFARVALLDPGRDQRFLDRGIAVVGLPGPVLAPTCDAAGALAAPDLAETLCGTRAPTKPARPLTALPAPLATAIDRATQAFVRPLHAADERARALGSEAEDGSAALREHADAIAAIESDLAPFIERFQLNQDASAGPLPLRCAGRWVESSFATRAAATASATAERARANAVLLLAAALDGRGATAALAAEAALPPSPSSRTSACTSGVEALAATAALMADARHSVVNARKNEAMRALTRSAGTQWAAAMALGFVFVVWSRRAARPALGVATALAAWAVAAWAARVPWPLAGGHDFVFARADPAWTAPPAPFVLMLVGLAAIVVLLSLSRRAAASGRVAPRRSMSSRIGYAGFVVATGAGWLLLLDLSLSAHAGNRYLALYHQGHLWLAMLTLSVFVFVRRPLARGFAWLLSVGGEAMQRASRRIGRIGVGVLLVVATLTAVAAFGVVLANKRQLTSELGRVWLIVGAAWFFFLRAGPLTERLAKNGRAVLSFFRYAWPILFVVGVLVAAMFITRDMGPLLIAGYAGGAFLAAAVAMWWHHRSGQVVIAFALALLLFGGWIAAITAGLFRIGAYDSVTASRLESVAAPFASINDQLALVSWFQRAAPAEGFGIGAVPWCGLSTGRGCSGVPAQIHSDYTFTALVGVFGPVAAWAGSLALAIWLHRLIRHHGRVTRGEPRLVGGDGQLGNDGQALISWISVAWVVLTSCQLAVTVAGNLAVLPLTGVTFPFVSFGMTSMLVNVAFLALCLNLDVAAAGRAGLDLPNGGRGG